MDGAKELDGEVLNHGWNNFIGLFDCETILKML